MSVIVLRVYEDEDVIMDIPQGMVMSIDYMNNSGCVKVAYGPFDDTEQPGIIHGDSVQWVLEQFEETNE